MRYIAPALIFLCCAYTASAEEWGTIKGQIVWGGAAIPPRPRVNVNKDEKDCLAKGPLLSDELIIDSKTLGIRDVVVWLAPVDIKKPLAIHPSLKAVPNDPVEIDQPCCQFVPRAVALRGGQPLIIKNSADIPHSASISGNREINPGFNLTISAHGKLVRAGADALKAENKVLILDCALHTWMHCRIGIFDHPYFAVTGPDGTFEIKNAPVGEVIIKMKHELWVHPGKTSAGHKVTIPAGGTRTLDLGKIKVQ